MIDPGTRIGAVHLTISDLRRSVRFYETHLGFSVHRRDERLEVPADEIVRKLVRVGRMEFDERAAVEFVQLCDPAGLRHGVPLMRQPTGVEHQREIAVGQLVGVHVWPGVKDRPP